MPVDYGAYTEMLYVCVSTCVKRLHTLPPRLYHNKEINELKSEAGDVRWRKAYGTDEDSPIAAKGERQQRGKFSGVQMETGECDRAFFHECLLKAPNGRGRRGTGSGKVPLQWHVPSG